MNDFIFMLIAFIGVWIAIVSGLGVYYLLKKLGVFDD